MSPVTLSGRVAWVFPDHFDVDQIVGVDNIRNSDPGVLRAACMASFAPDFAATVGAGDLLVAGRNFGYGHPHDQGMNAMISLGVAGVVAESFAPMFARSWEFLGLPLLACPGISAAVRRGDELTVEWEDGLVGVTRTGATLRGIPPSAGAVATVRAGGWVALSLERTTGRPGRLGERDDGGGTG